MGRVQEIYNGWKNYAFKNPQIEELAKNRIQICVNCPELKANNACRICGCYVPAKVRSAKSRCPKKKW